MTRYFWGDGLPQRRDFLVAGRVGIRAPLPGPAQAAVASRVRPVEVGVVDELLEYGQVGGERLRGQVGLGVHPALDVGEADLLDVDRAEPAEAANGLSVAVVCARADVDP
jgi:hypothetical protein